MGLKVIWKVVEAAYFQDYVGDLEVGEAPLSLLAPTWILVSGRWMVT